MIDLYIQAGIVISIWVSLSLVWLMSSRFSKRHNTFANYIYPVIITGALSFIIWPLVILRMLQTGGTALEQLADKMVNSLSELKE
jgi:hypothetical protein